MRSHKRSITTVLLSEGARVRVCDLYIRQFLLSLSLLAVFLTVGEVVVVVEKGR